MNSQADLFSLILQKSPQVDNLRSRAISGNKDTLQHFLNSIYKFLDDPRNHPAAYHQTNQFLISAQPSIAEQIDRHVLPSIIEKHCRQDLDEYIVFWKNIMPGTGDRRVYPNLYERLKNVKMVNQGHNFTTLSAPFKKFNATFLKNADNIFSKKFQFFEDFDDSIVSDSLDQGVSSDIIEMDMQQIKLIKQKVQNGPVDELTGEEFLKKIKNFLSLKPKTLQKQLSIDYNNDRIWAQQFLRNYDSFLEDGSLNLHKHFNPSGAKMDKVIQPNKEMMNSSRTNINIHQMPQQVHYIQQPFKKQNSKRFELTTQNLAPNPQFRQLSRQVQYDQPKQNIELAGRKTQIPQVILNTDEIDRSRTAQSYQLPRKDTRTQHLSNPIPQPTYNMVNSEVDHMQIMGSRMPNSNSFAPLPQQMSPDRFTNNSMARSRQRPKIFGNSSMRSKQKQRQQLQQPQEGNLEVIKYKPQQHMMGARGNNGSQVNFYRHTINQTPSRNWTPLSNQNQFNRVGYNTNQNFIGNSGNLANNNQNSNFLLNPQNNQYSQHASVTPKNQKISGFYDTISPNTAFGNKTAYGGGTSYKKLSQFNREKRQRKMGLQNQQLIPIQNFLVLPYCQNFNDMGSFSRFRRNCLQDNFTLYASPLLLISCIIKREAENKIKAQILFHNQSKSNLSLQTLYRVPKCLKVEKYSQISKRWSLKDQTQHIFGLELLQFPLEPCLLNLKYALELNYEDFKYHQPIIVSLPITMRNFIECLVLNEQEWIQKWTKWTELDYFRIYRNIILQKQVLQQDELTSALKQFTVLNPIQGYSVKQFGAYCRQANFDNLTFLIRISQRIENIMTLQLVADRKIRDKDYIDYLEYALNMWSMLLAKIDSSSMV